MRKKVYVLTAVLAAAMSLTGCKVPEGGWGSLSGRVTMSSTGEPLAGVSVVYGDSSVYTSEDGQYFYESVPDGMQGFWFRLDGYYSQMNMVNISNGGTAVCDVAMDIITAGWAVGLNDSGYGTILYSSDAGRSWVRQGSGSMVPDVRLTDVFTVSDQVCWIAGDADTLRSTTVLLYTADGGNTWTNQGSTLRSMRPMSIAAVVAADKDTAWAVTADTSLVLKTVNAGRAWEVCRESSSLQYYTGMTVAGRNLWCCGKGADGAVMVEYSPDGGSTWSEIQVNAASSSQEPVSIYAATEQVLYLAGSSSMGVLRSSDGGQTWTQAMSPGVDLVSMEVCSDNYVWACGVDGIMYTTSDAFATRNEVHPADGTYATGTIASVSFLRDASRGACSVLSYTGETGTIYYTLDGGTVWSQSSVPFDFSIESIDFAGGRN